MEANLLRSVPVGPAEEADVGEAAPSFEHFYEATFTRLYTALCLVTGNRHEAEEIAQEGFVRVFERWDRIRALEDPTGYLFRVCMNSLPEQVPTCLPRRPAGPVPGAGRV